MSIEPEMLCVIRVPVQHLTQFVRCAPCNSDSVLMASDFNGLLCTTEYPAAHQPEFSMWAVRYDDPPLCPKCGAHAKSVPEAWLRPLPPPPVAKERKAEMTA